MPSSSSTLFHQSKAEIIPRAPRRKAASLLGRKGSRFSSPALEGLRLPRWSQGSLTLTSKEAPWGSRPPALKETRPAASEGKRALGRLSPRVLLEWLAKDTNARLFATGFRLPNRRPGPIPVAGEQLQKLCQQDLSNKLDVRFIPKCQEEDMKDIGNSERKELYLPPPLVFFFKTIMPPLKTIFQNRGGRYANKLEQTIKVLCISVLCR